MGLMTRVASAKKGTKSLKTTVPEGIAEFLELSDRDELEWKMDTHNNQRYCDRHKETRSYWFGRTCWLHYETKTQDGR